MVRETLACLGVCRFLAVAVTAQVVSTIASETKRKINSHIHIRYVKICDYAVETKS